MFMKLAELTILVVLFGCPLQESQSPLEMLELRTNRPFLAEFKLDLVTEASTHLATGEFQYLDDHHFRVRMNTAVELEIPELTSFFTWRRTADGTRCGRSLPGRLGT